MSSVERLIRIACHYNKLKFADFNREFNNLRLKDCKSIVYQVMIDKLGYDKTKLSIHFGCSVKMISFYINHHCNEYNVINHYTKIYENVKTQFESWTKSELDLAYSIVKTNYDIKNELRYEHILNENNRLIHQNDVLKHKLKRKNYVI